MIRVHHGCVAGVWRWCLRTQSSSPVCACLLEEWCSVWPSWALSVCGDKRETPVITQQGTRSVRVNKGYPWCPSTANFEVYKFHLVISFFFFGCEFTRVVYWFILISIKVLFACFMFVYPGRRFFFCFHSSGEVKVSPGWLVGSWYFIT